MPKQTKAKPVTVTRLPFARSGYKAQWEHSASPTKNNPSPDPYVVSQDTSDNWSCGCMIWTRTHPRTDCKHVMRVKLMEAVPAQVQVVQSMLAVQSIGRKFRDD